MGRGFDPHTLKEVLTNPSVYVIREGMVVFGFIEELEVIKLLILRGKIHVELHQTGCEFLIILGVGESELIVEFFLVHDLSISYLRELCTGDQTNSVRIRKMIPSPMIERESGYRAFARRIEFMVTPRRSFWGWWNACPDGRGEVHPCG